MLGIALASTTGIAVWSVRWLAQVSDCGPNRLGILDALGPVARWRFWDAPPGSCQGPQHGYQLVEVLLHYGKLQFAAFFDAENTLAEIPSGP